MKACKFLNTRLCPNAGCPTRHPRRDPDVSCDRFKRGRYSCPFYVYKYDYLKELAGS